MQKSALPSGKALRSCIYFSINQDSVQCVLRLRSVDPAVNIELTLIPNSDGHIDLSGATTIGQFLSFAILDQIK